MDTTMFILVLLVITALGFDFTNGFHDTGNAMATSIATGALRPKVAVGLAAILNLIGAFLSVEVAATITKNVLKIYDGTKGVPTLGLSPSEAVMIIFAGLIGGILWNLFTWLYGLPSSSSHALFGGLIGAGLAAVGTKGIDWIGITSHILLPAIMAPMIACLVAAVGTACVYAITKRMADRNKDEGFRWGQIATASLVALAHGTGDAQKTMGVIAMALIVTGHLDPNVKENGLPVWVITTCAVAIALGTYLGGWRIIRTLGKGLVEIAAPQGMAAEASSAAIILTSSAAGMSLSTTHVATGSILGSGVGKPGAAVRWTVAGRMVAAWVTTLPMAGLVGAICYFGADLIGGLPGAIVIFSVLVAGSAYMYWRAQQQKVDSSNVNEEWDEDSNSPVPPTVANPATPATSTTSG